ncbi:MAG: Crp/Fnr family transcriptional regulator [Fibrobacter sp.]|uniref:Crp/Fnr family transcriptional regulator n=1 Tax=Fibrobacter sp. TaxID=35828 RepID=UPI001B166C28|nr:Crp/Fnr family transcriptional regulator [Fibrobacter sp.]MBO7060320.1 Crp/Fnr family transcriptional regulator [Fibrobacter sp.]MBR3670958.1 Crp/Fnr family transcriptional regulator [Fibrobacter sp.]
MLVTAGEYVCLESDKANTLFIVMSGMIVAETQDPGSGERYINFGPGSIIDELSLLEGAPRQYTLRAAEPSELMVISKETLNETLEQKPSWIKAILQFLSGRYHIAEENKRKNGLIQALPPLLYIISSNIKRTNSDKVELKTVLNGLRALAGTSTENATKLLDMLQDLGILKVQDDVVHTSSLQIVTILYETIKYRALTKKISPNILSMTDQMILSTFLKVARESSSPRPGGICTVTTKQLCDEAKKSMHGFTLTTRTMGSLVERKLLFPSATYDVHMPIEEIQFFYADFDKVMDLIELNRVFPLLDKKLVN